MPAHVTLEGFDQLSQALRQLPDDLAAQSRAIVRESAIGSLEETRSGYPEKSGEMRRRLTSREIVGPGRFAVLVQSEKFYAWFWEKGTKPRFTRKKQIPRGQVPAHVDRALWTIADRYKTAMQIRLVELCRAAGFKVDNVLD